MNTEQSKTWNLTYTNSKGIKKLAHTFQAVNTLEATERAQDWCRNAGWCASYMQLEKVNQ